MAATEDFDFVILGSGAPGKLLAWTLAARGKRVAEPTDVHDEITREVVVGMVSIVGRRRHAGRRFSRLPCSSAGSNKKPGAVSGAWRNSTHPISPLRQLPRSHKNKNTLSFCAPYPIGAMNSAGTRSASQTLSLPA